ncbi:group II intron reverse transcriptase/maturase [Heyndrickxia oleronia]|uniref:group II intron reverse transcriptase/maturase n=1 Tax=Heyndrickxia oleronia TaxID=38875 RepID=UPI0007172958|nr:group II intron reverse transcriptase/maturase [Heyndrickxia oleronia]MCM3454796.1 group II intron reverse transcriptase/maturase [Heyndrickxia oleronia]NYV66490.1 group II intron reverse transcriptase/maturase [Bacillus sp. Gen3]GIN41524.1 group II intron reverse transcriptase/maturase [Heyndrickxia oleronia]
MQTQLRYWEYYGMTETFDSLYEDSKEGKSFNRLYDIITSRENILLAYRTIKTNKGSKTPGMDKRTIDDFRKFSEEQLVAFIQKRLENYQPMKVKRVFIPKPSGDKRPLGIPSMSDRIIQQAFKQVLEPICEARFYNHSYGFRPLRSTHHAIARVNYLINKSELHYVVDIDIKGFFDNVNHSLLIKQLWNIGIRDRKVLRIISKMLKAEIAGEGIPSKGTPQGGILSPLLSNVVLNDLDQWVAGQWENFQSNYEYAAKYVKYKQLKQTNLKEGFIVRYADDFKILCRDWKTAQRWYHAVRLYLKDRLKLDISPEKSKVINLRKNKSDFLGFTIKAKRNGNKRVAISNITSKKQRQYVQEGKNRIKQIHKSPTAKNVILYNSWVLGIQNYSKGATHVYHDFKKIAWCLRELQNNRLGRIGRYECPMDPPQSYKRFYKNKYKTYKICGMYLFPLADIRHKSIMSFSQWHTPFTCKGRNHIFKTLSSDIAYEIKKLMESSIPNRSVEYFDNRISRYSMRKGKCEITGEFIPAEFVHCHHYKPINLGGTDEFRNLRILHKYIHVLVHASDTQTIFKYLKILNLDDIAIKKINEYRKKCNLEPIN